MAAEKKTKENVRNYQLKQEKKCKKSFKQRGRV